MFVNLAERDMKKVPCIALTSTRSTTIYSISFKAVFATKYEWNKDIKSLNTKLGSRAISSWKSSSESTIFAGVYIIINILIAVCTWLDPLQLTEVTVLFKAMDRPKNSLALSVDLPHYTRFKKELIALRCHQVLKAHLIISFLSDRSRCDTKLLGSTDVWQGEHKDGKCF